MAPQLTRTKNFNTTFSGWEILLLLTDSNARADIDFRSFLLDAAYQVIFRKLPPNRWHKKGRVIISFSPKQYYVFIAEIDGVKFPFFVFGLQN